jgi:hypothetical protein
MRKVVLIPLFLLFTLFAGDFLFLTDRASAGCCMCGTCKWGCTCRGTTAACPSCAFPSSPMVSQLRQPFSRLLFETHTSNLVYQLADERQCQQKMLRFTLLGEKYPPFNEQVFFVGEILSVPPPSMN